MTRIRKTLTATALAAALLTFAAWAGTAAPASAATITRETLSVPFTDSGIQHDCRAGTTGSIEGMETREFQTVETRSGFHVAGTNTGSGRIDCSDGSYSLIGWNDHFAFNAAARGATVFTLAHVDHGDTYSADGVFLDRLTFRLAEHITVTTGDVTRVDFDRGRLHVFGDC